jgi:fucose 4-O-acetylase-like acetyltransferase
MPTKDRRNDIDWLRIGAVYLLFVFHSVMVFNPAPFYHVRNGDLSIVMMIVAGFISLWHMPLLFLLAGWSVLASVESRGAGAFVKERILKLFVPLVACSALFGPIIKYIELRGGLDFNMFGFRVSPEMQESFRQIIPSGIEVAPPFHESFLEFWPTFFTNPERFTWSHLWFVAYLLTFTLLYYPLFNRLRRSKPIAETVRHGWVYAPIVPLALIQVFLRPHWPGLQNLYDDWANFAYYSTYLSLGFALALHPGFEKALHGERNRAAAIGLATVLMLLFAVLGFIPFEPLILAGTAVAGWCFNVALLGFAATHWRNRTSWLGYLRESAMPVYILHQPAIVVLGVLIIQLPLGIATKLVLLIAGSVGLTMLVYQGLVRHVALLRFCFGMKARKPGHSVSGERGHTRAPAPAEAFALPDVDSTGRLS